MKYRNFSPIGAHKMEGGFSTSYYARIQGRAWLLGEWVWFVIWNNGYGSLWKNVEGGLAMPNQGGIDALCDAHRAERGLEEMQQAIKKAQKLEAA